jgi:hypothetical protein
MPLVLPDATAEPLSEARERARKVLPRYAEGPLVRVATARHQAEAELLEGMLLEEGIPSLVRRTGGFDVPDFLASGPRELLAPARTAWRRPGEGTQPWVKVLAITLVIATLAIVVAGIVGAVFS